MATPSWRVTPLAVPCCHGSQWPVEKGQQMAGTETETGDAASNAIRRTRFGWYAYGWASHTFEATVIAVFISRYLPSVAANAVGENGRLYVLGIPIAPGSLFTYVISLCSFSLFVLMPLVGAIADRTGRKREMLLGFGYIGAAACAAMWFIAGSNWKLGSILLIVAYLAYTAAKVVYNSILPEIAAPDERDRVSSIGWAAGYVGGGLLLLLNFVASFFIADQALLARLSLSSAGIWWAAFALVPLALLRRLPKTRPVPGSESGPLLTAGFRELADTFRGLRRYRLTLLFLVAYLIYYDGVSTVVTLAADYGEKELKLDDNTLLTAILIVQFTAFGGALLLGRFAEWWGAKRVISVSLLVWIGVVVAAYFLQAGSVVQFYTLAMVLSIVMGGTQALSRSLFSSMIPAGKEAEYFSLYEISSSGTSALGPLVFGLTLQNTGSYRAAIFSLVVFFVVGLVLLLRVNVRRAVVEAGNVLPATLRGSSEVGKPPKIGH
jgi:UMF1 family MFS transporter